MRVPVTWSVDGQTGRRAQRERGFTLVELMVVIVIVGLIAGVAVLSLPDPSGGIRVEAERFAARAKAAQEAALINARATSLRVEPGGYAIAESNGGEWRDIGRFEWERGTTPELSAGRSARTMFDSTGLAEPLEVTLRRDDQRARIVIGTDGDITIRR